MFTKENIALHAELLKTAEEKVAIDPAVLKLLATGLAGGVGVGVPVYMATRHYDDLAKERAKNQSFGAGVATGLAGPRILRGALNLVDPTGGNQ
jgi:energy-converting hydrogenase Eha subunit G